MSTESLGIDGSEVELALVLLSNGLEGLRELLSLLRGLGEDIGEGNASGHVSGVGLRADLTDERGGGLDNEGGDVLGDELLREGVLLLVEGLVEDDGRGLDTLSLGNGSIVDTTEEVGVSESLSDTSEGLVGGLVIGIEVGDDDNLVGGLELLEGILGQDGNSGEGLLDHVGGDAKVIIRWLPVCS